MRILAVALCLAVSGLPLGALAQAGPEDALTVPIRCDDCASWNTPHAPVHLYGNSDFVGTEGLSSILVRTSAGLVLIDGALPQSAARIEDNLRALGLKVQDLRLILVSHEHMDHVGGVAALQRDSGARVLASPAAARALATGAPTPEDPQFAYPLGHFPPARVDGTLTDGQAITVGDVTFTAHLTPGHTPGSTSWTWISCEGGRCLRMVYADSLTPVASAGFHYLPDALHGDLTATFRASIARVAALPCDILLTPHPGASDFWERVARRSAGDADALLDRAACRQYAARADAALDQRISEERGAEGAAARTREDGTPDAGKR